MKPEDIKLPGAESSVFVSDKLLRHIWVMDPPPWIVSRLRDDLLINIYGIKMRHLAQLAKVEAQIKEIEADMFNEIARAMTPKG